ncbi:MAG: hypothetical protein LBS50_09495 [Prevotellaceae bacterium]|jgi:hypothetical protein|nr:hypothetical protein [Prevotellaceae bacterium]
MATAILNYDARNKQAINTINFILSLGFFQLDLEKKQTKNYEKIKNYPYNKVFVEELVKSRNSKGVKIKDSDLWK